MIGSKLLRIREFSFGCFILNSSSSIFWTTIEYWISYRTLNVFGFRLIFHDAGRFASLQVKSNKDQRSDPTSSFLHHTSPASIPINPEQPDLDFPTSNTKHFKHKHQDSHRSHRLKSDPGLYRPEAFLIIHRSPRFVFSWAHQ